MTAPLSRPPVASLTRPPLRSISRPLSRVAFVLSVLALAACTAKNGTPQRPDGTASGEETSAEAVPAAATQTAASAVLTSAARPSPAARTAAQFDTTTREQKAVAAAAPTSPERKLGTTVASLGDPSQPGFWVKTPLVSAEADGRIVNPANGKSAKVRLIPLGGPAGGGSQVSLPALQLIGVSLTDLPTLEVYQG